MHDAIELTPLAPTQRTKACHTRTITILLALRPPGMRSIYLAVGWMAHNAEAARLPGANFVFGHSCPYCRVAVNTLAEIADDAAAIGTRIIAIVPDRQQHARHI
jgi:hypothetical protein